MPTDRALALATHELATLTELAEAFGRADGRDAIAAQLALALMGGRLVRRVAVALGRPPEVVLVRGAVAPAVPDALADLDAPTDLDAGSPLAAGGWARAVPLTAGRVRRGVVLLGPSAPRAPAGAGFEAALAALAVGALEAADRADERAARARVDEEIRLARGIQQRLLPPPTVPPPGLDVAIRWVPGREVSGDTYWTSALPDGRLVVAVADVVGKGLPAALLMATLQAGLRMLAPDLTSGTLGEATARLDRLVAESTEPHQFVTMAWAVVGADGRVAYCVAGHPAPRVVRAAGTVEALGAGGPLLGVLPGARFEVGSTQLAPGDALVLHTDGLGETPGVNGAEFEDALDDVLAATTSAASAEGLLAALVVARDAFAAGDGDDDDLTLVAVRRET